MASLQILSSMAGNLSCKTVRHKTDNSVGSRRIIVGADSRTLHGRRSSSSFNGRMSSEPRSVRIGDNERGGWSSDRPRKPGEAERPPRKQDVSVRGRVLSPTDRMRYNPGSLLVIACADRTLRDRFAKRVIEEQSALFSLDKVRGLIRGKVPDAELDAKAQALLDA